MRLADIFHVTRRECPATESHLCSARPSSGRSLAFGAAQPRYVGQHYWRGVLPDPAGVLTSHWRVAQAPRRFFGLIPLGGERVYCFGQLNADALIPGPPEGRLAHAAGASRAQRCGRRAPRYRPPSWTRRWRPSLAEPLRLNDQVGARRRGASRADSRRRLSWYTSSRLMRTLRLPQADGAPAQT
jgi:hypothetical protein